MPERLHGLRTLVAFVALVTVGRAALLAWPSVNLEFAFADAALYFQSGDASLMAEYFSLQANTVAIPWGVGHLAELAGGVSPLGIARALSLCGVALLAWGLQRLCRQLGRPDAVPVIVYVVLNPLVWIYASRATADFLPVAVGLLAVSFLCDEALDWRRAVPAGLLLGLAAVMKYHAVFLLLFVVAIRWQRGGKAFPPVPVGLALTCVAVPLIAYLVATHRAFGFWVTPPEFQAKHQFSPLGLLSNAVCYAGYLTLLAWPTLILMPRLRHAILRHPLTALAVLAALCATGALLVSDNGEMNFGPLDRWVPPQGRTALFAVFAAGILLPLALAGRDEGARSVNARRSLWAAGLALLLLLSFTRPAQRYLLFVIPFMALAMPAGFFSNRRLFFATITLFCAANLFVDASRWSTGTAAAQMVDEVRTRGLLDTTDPGAALPHAGSPFYRVERGQSAYTIVAGTVPGALVVTQAGRSVFARSFSLVRSPASVRPTPVAPSGT